VSFLAACERPDKCEIRKPKFVKSKPAPLRNNPSILGARGCGTQKREKPKNPPFAKAGKGGAPLQEWARKLARADLKIGHYTGGKHTPLQTKNPRAGETGAGQQAKDMQTFSRWGVLPWPSTTGSGRDHGERPVPGRRGSLPRKPARRPLGGKRSGQATGGASS